MKKEQIKKIVEELEERKEAKINYTDGSSIIILKHSLYGINLFIEDKIKTYVRTFKNIKELKNYLININIY